MLQLLPRGLASPCFQHLRISTSALAFKGKVKGRRNKRNEAMGPKYFMNDESTELEFIKQCSEPRLQLYSEFDWSDVYPSEKPFDPYLVNLPVRAGGHRIKRELPPSSEGNVVFWDSPNFFHLTPPAIKKHCAALKPLCTPWPPDLPYCPVQVETVDFLLSGNDRYHPDARKVRMEIDFDALKLTGRAREKMLELLQKKYDIDRNVIRLDSERCPTKSQNRDYLFYLLKVLYYEANRSEEWEQMRLMPNTNKMS